MDEVLAANPKQLEQFCGGKTKLQGFFAGCGLCEDTTVPDCPILYIEVQKSEGAALHAGKP